jgi:hypothetical protein
MHLKKVTALKNCSYVYHKSLRILFFAINFFGAFCHPGKFSFLKSTSKYKYPYFWYPYWHIKKKIWPYLVEFAYLWNPKCKVFKKPLEIWENVFSKHVSGCVELFKSIRSIIKIQKKDKNHWRLLYNIRKILNQSTRLLTEFSS